MAIAELCHNARISEATFYVSHKKYGNPPPTDMRLLRQNGQLRAECLNKHCFMNLNEAMSKIEEWRRDYDDFRPHSAIGNKPPISLLNGSSAASPS